MVDGDYVVCCIELLFCRLLAAYVTSICTN